MIPLDSEIASDTSTSSLNEPERAQCAALARWLEASAVIGTLGLFAAAAAMAIFLIPGNASSIPAAALTLALTPIERVYALRLRFDRGLFADLADGRLPDLAALDAALSALSLRKSTARSRALADRIRGAGRLWRSHAAVVAAQVLLCLFAVALRV